VLYEAQRGHRLATTGAYARLRHPQYIAFVLIMTGFLLQWPTLVTLAMYPVLVMMYAFLGKREEKEMLAQFGDEYRRYRRVVPAFIPRFGAPRTAGQI
jgi:protein-S-isoprenylcysteine O-methyltransferase Ste14